MGGRGKTSGGGGGGPAKKPYEKPKLTGGKPELTGSDKQKEWAHTLRESYIAVHGQTHPEATARTVAAHPEARYWIDNRYGLGTTNSEQRAMQALWRKK